MLTEIRQQTESESDEKPFILMGVDYSNPYYCTDMYMYCIERSVNISITRITRVNNKYFCYVAISDDISTHAEFQVDSYHGC